MPADSTISWNCPSCGNTNFIINNAASDVNGIQTNALGPTSGVDTLPAGTYNTVVVDTTGGPWTVAVGTTAAAPVGGPTSSSSASPAPQGAPSSASASYVACDPNISVAGGADCAFAENTFYEYWTHQGAASLSVYSAATGTTFTMSCGGGAEIVCSTNVGGIVRFPQSALAAYSQSQADAYASSHNLGP